MTTLKYRTILKMLNQFHQVDYSFRCALHCLKLFMEAIFVGIDKFIAAAYVALRNTFDG